MKPGQAHVRVHTPKRFEDVLRAAFRAGAVTCNNVGPPGETRMGAYVGGDETWDEWTARHFGVWREEGNP